MLSVFFSFQQPAKTVNKKDLKNAELSALVKSVKRKASGLKK